ncbi:hypothetical protein LSAT2_000303 [Lamellibrachia satsuma]|nr:hypothetical protein LSAT2_000303 [Lamellibrachia satsuma]
MTALHWSAFHNRPEHICLLLDKGADVFVQDIDGKTALHWTAQNGCESCSRILGHCYHGNDLVNQLDYSGKAAIHFAASSGHAEIICELAEVNGCDLEIEDRDERTPLHWATAAGQADCVRTLLDLGVQPNPVDSEGGTPLDYARQSGCQECTQLTEARLGLQTDSGHLEACDVNSHLPRARKNPFNFILNLFKSKRTEKSLKAKFVHEENVESEQFSSDSVFDDSNENNLETTNLNIGEVPERTLCQGGACSRDWDTEDTVLTPTDRFESDSNRHFIRSPPPILKYDTNSPSRCQGEKTGPVGGAMDKLSMCRSDGSPLTSRISKSGSETHTRHSLPQMRTDGSIVQLAPIKGPVPPKQGVVSSVLLDRRLEALRSERSGLDRPPTPPDWRIPPKDRSASLPMSPANLEALFPAHSKKKRNRQLLLLKQNNSFDSISDKDSPPQSSSSTKSHDRTGKVGTSQLPADFYEQRHSMDKSIQHLLH